MQEELFRKPLEQRVRPECELTACIVHGRGIFVYIADPTLSFGSDWNIEVFSRSLQCCWEMAQKNGSPWPPCAKLFSDNTPKDQSFNVVKRWIVVDSCLMVFVFESLVHSKTNPAGNQELGLWPVLLFDDDNSMLWYHISWAPLCGSYPRRRRSDPECTFQVFTLQQNIDIQYWIIYWHHSVNCLPPIMADSTKQCCCLLRCSIWPNIPIDQRRRWRYVWNSAPALQKSYSGPQHVDLDAWNQAMPPRFGEVPRLPTIAENSSIIFLTRQLEVLEWSVDNTFSCKRALLPSSLRDVGERLVKQYGALFNYVWRIPKAKKDDKLVPHSFTFVRRDCSLFGFRIIFFLIEMIHRAMVVNVKCFFSYCLINWSVNSGLPMHLVASASNHLPRRFGESPSDVFLLIKGFVSDRELSQPPLIVWPGCKYQESLDSLYRIGQNQVNCD